MNKKTLIENLTYAIEQLKKELPVRTIDSVTFIEEGSSEPFRVN